MASKNTVNTVIGDRIIISNLAKYFGYKKTQVKFLFDLSEKGIVAVETLLEEAISIVGNIKRSGVDGQDFVDGSDAKKSIVSTISLENDARGCTICNVKNKNSILRVMAADPLINEVFFFKIPNKELKNRHNLKINFSRSGGEPDVFRSIDSFSKRIWKNYRVKTFEELCN